MAIPQGRLSTTPVERNFLTPEDKRFYALVNHERGPIHVEDTTEGLLYQDWVMYYDDLFTALIIEGQTSGDYVVALPVINPISATFTFDQNGRVTIAYTTAVSSYLYWYDSALAQTVTTDLGADCITPAILLDDKRDTQSAVNDMLLWYTKLSEGSLYELYMRRQRDRFITEYLMASGLAYPYIHNIGMNAGLRVQMVLKPTVPSLPYY